MGLRMIREAQETTATEKRNTIAAIFPDERHARMAMRELEELGFKHAWMGIVRADEALKHLPIVDSADGGGVFEAIGRMFGGEGDRSLHTVLTSHGIPTERARALVSRVEPRSAVVTVEVDGLMLRVVETLEAHGGDIGRPPGLRTDRGGPVFDSSAVFL